MAQNQNVSWDLLVSRDQVSQTLANIERDFAAVRQATTHFESAANNSFSSANTHARGFRQTLSQIGSEIPGLGRALELATNPYVAGATGIAAIGTGLYQAAKGAAEFEKGMAKFNVTAQVSQSDLSKISDEAKKLSKPFGTPLSEVPIALEKIISAGLTANETMSIFPTSLKAAKSGFVDVATAADAAVSVMKSAGLGTSDINNIYDKLFATVNKGKADFKDVVQYLPNLIFGAKAAGLSLDEVAGSFALLTTSMQADAATTGIQNLTNALSEADIIYGTKSSLGFAGNDIKVFDKGQFMGLMPIIDQVKAKIDTLGNNQEAKTKFLDSLGLDQEASKALQALLTGADELRTNIDFIAQSSTNAAGGIGQLDAAYKNSANSTDSWATASRSLDDVMDSFGKLTLPIVVRGLDLATVGLDAANGLATAMGDAMKWASNNTDIMAVSAGALGVAYLALNAQSLVLGAQMLVETGLWRAVAATRAIAATGTGLLTAAQTALNIAIAANPIGLLIAGLAAAGAGMYIAYQKSETFRGALWGIMEVAKSLMPVFKGLGETIIGALTFNPALAKKGFEDSAKAIAEITNKGGIGSIFKQGYGKGVYNTKPAASNYTLQNPMTNLLSPQTPMGKAAKEQAQTPAGKAVKTQAQTPMGKATQMQAQTPMGKATQTQAPKENHSNARIINIDDKGLQYIDGNNLKTPDVASSPTTSSGAAVTNNRNNTTNNATTKQVTINKMIETVVFNVQNDIGMSMDEFKRKLEQALTDAVRDFQIVH